MDHKRMRMHNIQLAAKWLSQTAWWLLRRASLTTSSTACNSSPAPLSNQLLSPAPEWSTTSNTACNSSPTQWLNQSSSEATSDSGVHFHR
jgi:hypothetical protein